jgi:hypothetical protein
MGGRVLSATYAANLWANDKNNRNQSDFTGFLQSQIDAGIMKLPDGRTFSQEPDIGDPAEGRPKTVNIRARNAAGVDKLFTSPDRAGFDWSDVAEFIKEGAAPAAPAAPPATAASAAAAWAAFNNRRAYL